MALGFGIKWILDTDFSSTHKSNNSKVLGRRAATSPPNDEHKMVLVVNDSLKMGKGKIGAQCAHAAVGLVDRERRRRPEVLRHWESTGQAKICLKAKDDVELRKLAATAGEIGIPYFIVQDAGRTQVAAGSRTVLAIGPAPKSALDKVTGNLKLL